MKLVGNALNGVSFDDIVRDADVDELESVALAVAYVREFDELMEITQRRGVPVTLYALADEGGFPKVDVITKFVNNSPPSWQMFLTRRYYHPKIAWFRGVGCYIGSANLTENGRIRNLECGVWMDEDELCGAGFDIELAAMLAVVRARSVIATKEHIALFEKLDRARTSLFPAQREYERRANELLSMIPGQDSPHFVPAGGRRDGGAARLKFVEEWNRALTTLRKLGQSTSKMPRPHWVGPQVTPAVALDQATEYFYTLAVRKSGRKRDEVVDELQRANRRNPEGAVAQVFRDWAAFDGHEGTWEWAAWCNEHPARLRDLLSRESLGRLTAAELGEVVWLTHSAREYARQVKNATLGLPEGTKMEVRARCDEFARYLLGRKTTKHERRIREVLTFVIWGDREQAEAAVRIWDGTQKAEWRLPHLGPSILGEMIGYARPDEFPPRNQRVIRTLVALGFEGLTAE